MRKSIPDQTPCLPIIDSPFFLLMTSQDENELQRLCQGLQELGETPGITAPQVEALKKAGFGLTLAFVAGLRDKIELLYNNAPLTAEEKQKLRALGLDPEEH